MTKKLIVIILSVILCLAVVGGCFALYVKNADQITITFGSEQAVVLTTTVDGGTLNFNASKLQPGQSATQGITLDVSGVQPSELAGMSGELTVTVSGDASSIITLSATYDGLAEPLTATNGTLKCTLPLNSLPKNFTLKAEILSTVTKDTFKSNSNKSATITVSWKAVDWAPVEGGYYIVGDHCAWGVNENAILMNGEITQKEDPTQNDLAVIHNVNLKKGEKFKVVKWTEAGGVDWTLTYNAESKGVTVNCDEDGNVSPNATDSYFICVNNYGVVWIQPESTVGQ